MSYSIKDIRGQAQESISFMKEIGGIDLFEKIKDTVIAGLKECGVPATVYEDTMKSGGLFGTVVPILVIQNNVPGCKYFDIGIVVNNVTVSFPLFGESAQNTKFNKKEFYEKNNNYFKAAFTNPDEFKLQEEAVWRSRVLDCFNSLLG